MTAGEWRYETQIQKQPFQTVEEERYTIAYQPVLDQGRVEHISELIHQTETCLQQYGFHFDTTRYQMKRTIYFPWESSREKVLFSYKDETCHVNFYAESMYRLSDEELISRYIYSRLKQSNQFQEIAAQILIDDVSSRVLHQKTSALLEQFSYDTLVENYGSCVSPKQCMAAECIRTDAESFANLYNALKHVQDLKEMDVEKLHVNDAYKKVYRRIVE